MLFLERKFIFRLTVQELHDLLFQSRHFLSSCLFYIYFELIVYEILATLSKIFRFLFVFDYPFLSEKY